MKIAGNCYIPNRVTNSLRGLCFYFQDTLSVEECTLLKDYTFDKSCWGELRLRKKIKNSK